MLSLMLHSLARPQAATSPKCAVHQLLHRLPFYGIDALQTTLACFRKTACNDRRRLHMLWHCLLKGIYLLRGPCCHPKQETRTAALGTSAQQSLPPCGGFHRT